MSFKDKIDKILSFNKLNINSVSALEDYLKCGRGAINDYYKKDREPGGKTLRRILSLPDLNVSWWTGGYGEPFESEIKAVSEPSINYQDDLIRHLKVANDHLMSLTEDLRKDIIELKKDVQEKKLLIEKLRSELKH